MAPQIKLDSQITFLATTDLKSTSLFYEQILGLDLVLDQGTCRIFKVSGNAYIGFCQKKSMPSVEGVIITFVTQDVDGFCGLLKKLEVEFPGLEELIERVKEAADRGWLKGLDGRKIPIRSKHAALNSLLQSAGAVIMKKAMVIGDKMIQAKGLVPGVDYEQVLFVHDELQVEVLDFENNVQIVADCMEQAIRLAGEHLKKYGLSAV